MAKTAAAPKAPKLVASAKPRKKSELYALLGEHTQLSRKQIASVFETLEKVMVTDLSKPGANKPRMFVVPGLMKLTATFKPASKATTKPNPFKPGEMMEVKAKPAKTVLKIRALKNLKGNV